MIDSPGMRLIKRAAGLHDAIADDLKPFGGLLRCGACGREEDLGNVAAHLRSGWPECCGHTMSWRTAAQLERERLDAQP